MLTGGICVGVVVFQFNVREINKFNFGSGEIDKHYPENTMHKI
jgi:hypothetical protein